EFLDQPALRWGLLILIAVLFAITNLPWHLDDYDQAKQAFTSFEMVNGGHWLYQHTPNEKIATKPPLVGWVSAACFAVTRSWDLAWRLPSMAAAILLLGMLRHAALRAYGTGAAVLAVAAFGLNLLAPRLATLVRTDMPLALIVFLLGLKIWEKIREAQPWHARDRLIMFALLTAAMLIKGPIVYAFLLPGIAAFQWLKRRDKVSAWCGWWPWVASLAIFLLWVAGGIYSVPGFYDQVVLKEFAGRFGETMHRPQPLFFYLPHLLQKFAPWSLLSLGLAIVAWRAGKRNLRPEMLWLVVWSLGGLVVMSLIPSKRVDRIFPIVPPLCLLIAAQFSPESRSVRRWSAIAVFVAVFLTSAYAAGRMVNGYRGDEGALARFGATVRREAAANNWRYEVIGGKEEGLLLYLRRTRFVRPEEAIDKWKANQLDAVVVPADDSSRFLQEMPGAIPSGLEASIMVNGQPRRYLLLRKANRSSTSRAFDATVPSS
ncbi:MAG: ArnT family glycosyltransferase, partial [Chthoniobacterales bacterium]